MSANHAYNEEHKLEARTTKPAGDEVEFDVHVKMQRHFAFHISIILQIKRQHD